ncbi:hypothetical protein U9M48_033103 [Paspalum notatum var. saurae]|uniref:HMA domain-containing protein n=1 Tax=Paspalum notatum var. saurae TaxID=547442 RepID=A0AAQ3U6M2_PASNO
MAMSFSFTCVHRSIPSFLGLEQALPAALRDPSSWSGNLTENRPSLASQNTCYHSITIELKIYMHCDACERRVRRAISKVEGVETIEVDREENKVTVTGGFEPEKVVKKIKKKTGKKAEILTPEEDEEETGEEPYVAFPYNDPVLYPDADVPEEFQSYRAVAFMWQLPPSWMKTECLENITGNG